MVREDASLLRETPGRDLSMRSSRSEASPSVSTRSRGIPLESRLELLRNSCVPSRLKLTETVNFLIIVKVDIEYRQMYLLFPAASKQVPSAEYVMVVNDLVLGLFAAVLREESVRPPETSRRPSITTSWTLVSMFQKLSWPSRLDAAICCESGLTVTQSKSDVN